ncbi:MAG: hypothetical protein U0166_19575 [Acidobacteriota bacterium]
MIVFGSGGEIPGYRLDDGSDAARSDAVHALAELQPLGLVEADRELLLDGLGVLVAAHGDVAPEARHALLDDVDVHHRGADVDEGDDLVVLGRVVLLVSVLEREGVDVHDDGVLPRLGDDARVVVDLLFLHRDEQDVHVLGAAGALPLEDAVVQVDVLDVERDVLLRFPVDGLVELASLIFGKAIFLMMTAWPDREVVTSGLLLPAFEALLDGVDHGRRVHDAAVDDGLGREGSTPTPMSW